MAVVDETRYKSNSYKSKAEAEKREVQKVTKGEVRVHQKTTGEKFNEKFGELGEYLVNSVLIPLGRDLLDAAFTSTKDLILYGEVREAGRRGGTSRRGTYVDYTYSSRRNTPTARRARFDFSYIEFDSLDDIRDVIKEMRTVWDLCPEPKEISVAQYYQCADPDNLVISPTDNNWGWTDIRAFLNADMRRISSRNPETGEREVKWILDLPRPKPLDW